jgi:L-malate glycosyltransferase
MHIAIAGPFATADMAGLLGGDVAKLPHGYEGAPLLVTLTTELLAQGHRVTAITLSADIPLHQQGLIRVSHGDFELIYCPMRPRAWRMNGLLPGRIVDLYAYERRVLQRAIKQAQPDVVHSHWAYEFSLAALISGLPHVVTCHDSPYAVAKSFSRERPTRSLYRWLRVLMARKVLREAKAVTTVSPYMRDALKSLTTVPVSVIPNPIDPFAFALSRNRLPSKMPRIAMVCNGWSERKNPQPALKAFAQLRKSHSCAELHLYGHDFGIGEVAEQWARHHCINEGITFHGSRTHHQLLRALGGVDLLLHPALEESFGMVIAEAMAMCLPIVAGKSSGAVPWVLGSAGILCDVRNVDDICNAILEILKPETYQRLSQSGRQRVQEIFSQQAVATAYQKAYSSSMEQAENQVDALVHAGIPL